MKNVYIFGGLRTPLAKHGGHFRSLRPECFTAELLSALLKQYSINEVDAIFCGNAVGTGGNLARLTALLAGIDERVPAVTIDMQCASAAASLDFAFSRLASGQGHLYVAGGMESRSLQPVRRYAETDERHALFPHGEYMTAQFSPKELTENAMLRGAERTAKEEKVSRTELEEWAVRSHARAAAARREGSLQELIFPVAGLSKDDGIRETMSFDFLKRLPPLFGTGGLTTAGTSCRTNDGAALALLCSEEYLTKMEKKPEVRLLAMEMSGGDPLYSPRGAMQAADQLLERMRLSYEDMAAIEFNEAFAVIDVLFARRYPKLVERYNTFGGALAYGHPYGASGALLLLHLIEAVKKHGGGYGLLSIAGAGGVGEAILLEVCE